MREGDLVADETTANAVITPAASGVTRSHSRQSACLGHDAVDDVGEVEQGSKYSRHLELGEQVDPRGIAATGIRATVGVQRRA